MRADVVLRRPLGSLVAVAQKPLEIIPWERVLDVACGSGNTALAAARRFAEAVGVDYVPELLAHGRERAAAEGLEVEFV